MHARSRRSEPSEPKKRFTVTLDPADYERLRSLAESHRPRLTLQYVIQYAVQRLLEQAKDPNVVLRLGDPLTPKEGHGDT